MIIENETEVKTPRDNTIISEGLKCSECNIEFRGSGNILFAEPGVDLADSKINFFGDGALLYLSSNTKHPYRLKIDLWRETTVFFGYDNYFNGIFSAIVSERQNLVVGNNGVFSFGIWLRTADPHLLYDVVTAERINMSRSILVGDHVWIGQNALILKGCKIGSGSVVSAAAVLANKVVPSNCVFAGNPAKEIKENIFFIGKSVHNYTKKKTEKSMRSDFKDYIYREPVKRFDVDTVFAALTDASDAQKRLDIVQEKIAGCTDKDRFFIGKDIGTYSSKGLLGKLLRNN